MRLDQAAKLVEEARLLEEARLVLAESRRKAEEEREREARDERQSLAKARLWAEQLRDKAVQEAEEVVRLVKRMAEEGRGEDERELKRMAEERMKDEERARAMREEDAAWVALEARRELSERERERRRAWSERERQGLLLELSSSGTEKREAEIEREREREMERRREWDERERERERAEREREENERRRVENEKERERERARQREKERANDDSIAGENFQRSPDMGHVQGKAGAGKPNAGLKVASFVKGVLGSYAGGDGLDESRGAGKRGEDDDGFGDGIQDDMGKSHAHIPEETRQHDDVLDASLGGGSGQSSHSQRHPPHDSALGAGSKEGEARGNDAKVDAAGVGNFDDESKNNRGVQGESATAAAQADADPEVTQLSKGLDAGAGSSTEGSAGFGVGVSPTNTSVGGDVVGSAGRGCGDVSTKGGGVEDVGSEEERDERDERERLRMEADAVQR